MITAILCNSVLLALYDYSDPDDQLPRNQILSFMDKIFTALYTIEAVLKILAQGFFVHTKSYLRDGWNVLDFIALTVSYISLIPSIPNLKALRILRVMRPLRSINAIPTMKRLFNTLLMSIPHIGQVVLFLIFIFAIFAILGNQLFQGDLYRRCRLTQKPIQVNGTYTHWPIDYSQNRLCGALYTCSLNTFCGAPQQFGIPLEKDNLTSFSVINYGYFHFDNLGVGILQIFRIITLEGWATVMYNYMDSVGFIASIYFPLLVVLGSFFLLNLFLAVIMETFSEMTEVQIKREQDKREAKIRRQKKAQNLKNGGEIVEKEGFKGEKALARMISVNQKKVQLQKGKGRSLVDATLMMLAKVRQEQQELRKLDDPQSIRQDLIKEEQLDFDDVDMNKSQEEDIDQKGEIDLEKYDSRKYDNLGKQTDMFEEKTNNNCVAKTRRFMLQICESRIFQFIITCSILINTICLALDKYPPEKELQDKLDILNLVFFCIFFLEMLIKITGLGPSSYIKDQFNIFDCIIVTLSVVDVIVTYSLPQSNSSGGGAISAFRAFRLLRVFKLAKSWTQLQNLLKTIVQSLKDISSFSVLLFLLIFIYVLIGLEIFSNSIKFTPEGQVLTQNQIGNKTLVAQLHGESPRNNFDDIFHAFLVVFQVLISDNWDEIMFTFARSKGYIAIAFFVSMIIIGVMFFLNIFLAILLENFGADNELMGASEAARSIMIGSQSDLIGDEGNPGISRKKRSGIIGRLIRYLKTAINGKDPNEEESDTGKEESPNIGNQASFPAIQDQSASKDQLLIQEFPNQSVGDMSPRKDGDQSGDETYKSRNNPNKKSLALLIIEKKNEHRKNTILMKSQSIKIQICEGRSLYLFGPSNCFRIFLAKLTKHSIFESFILILILISSVTLALDNPLNDPNGMLSEILFYIDITFTAIFALECVFKILAFGFVFNGRYSYLRDSWNCLDFFIVALSVLSLSMTSNQLKIVKIFRLIRVLRPLRLISRNKMLKIAIHALFMAIPSIFNVIVVSLLFFIIFGIIGVNYFKGTFSRCILPTNIPWNIKNSFLEIVTTKIDCLNYGGSWVNQDQNFDNMANAIITLIQMASTEGWAEVMNFGVDAVDIDRQPIKEYGLYWSLFFILFVLFGDFFIMNLFAGAVVMTFNKEKERLGKTYLLSDKQKRWLEQKRACLALHPPHLIVSTQNTTRQKVSNIINSTTFNYFIFTSIILNTIALGVAWFGEPPIVTLITSSMNYIFAFIFIVEAALKLYGYGPKIYFKDKWNRFDFLVVILTLIAEITSQAGGSRVGAAVTFIRAVRVQRLLRYIKRARRIRIIFQTFIVTLPSLGSVGALLMLFLYVYAILGVFLFSELKLQDNINYYANFQSFGLAFLTLMRCATGESWNAIMSDSMRQNSITFQCDESAFNYESYAANGYKTTGCGSGSAGVLFFISFYIMVPLIFLNLFIAIILEGFETTNQAMSTLLQEDDLEKFTQCWSHFDRSVKIKLSHFILQGSGFIRICDLQSLLFMLGEPLGWDEKRYRDNQEKQDDFMEDLHIPTYKEFQYVLFWDVIQSLAKMYLVRMELRQNLKQQLNNMEDDLSKTADEDMLLSLLEQQIGPNNNEEQKELKYQLRLELEFETIDVELREVMDVEIVRYNENSLIQSFTDIRDQDFTSAHLKAGRRIMQAMKRLIDKKRSRIAVNQELLITENASGNNNGVNKLVLKLSEIRAIEKQQSLVNDSWNNASQKQEQQSQTFEKKDW